jgi:maltose phosphorylase
MFAIRVIRNKGRKVLNGIARFWAQRFNWSEVKQSYVMLGVTGPNEYENNVNNNWYTNYIAKWCIEYALECEASFANTTSSFLTEQEIEAWSALVKSVYFPKLEGTRIFLQQDGFMDKEQLSVADIPALERPINQHWSWDRILRSIFIKQATCFKDCIFLKTISMQQQFKRILIFMNPKQCMSRHSAPAFMWSLQP